MEAYDLSHKLRYAGKHSRIPFTTGPEYTNSVPGVPVLAMVRVFLEAEHWTEDNVKQVAREIARVLGPTEQFDVGLTLSRKQVYNPNTPASEVTARLMKLDRNDPRLVLRLTDGNGDRLFAARFPRLHFEPVGEDFWRSIYAPGAVKVAGQS